MILWKCEGDPPSDHESRPDGTGSQEAEGLMAAAAGVQHCRESGWASHAC